MNPTPDWTINDADELYRISGWGAGYFRLNADGNLVVSAPLRNGKTAEIERGNIDKARLKPEFKF